jgi:diguanylate cyclase (GGDEF)-like protein
MSETFSFGEGITGWAVDHREAVLANQAHLDPRVRFVPGTPIEPEALIAVPLVARGRLKGTLNIYRVGEDAAFSDEEFLLAKRFGDAAALAIDNAHIRARLEHQAETDALTGLYNHRAFHDRLRHALLQASAAHDTVAVVMLDLDDFKKVNDTHGHPAGDAVLRTIGEVLGSGARQIDLAARYGGEEFVVLVPESDVKGATQLAKRLRLAISKARAELPDGRLLKVTASFGVAVKGDLTSAEQLIAAADEALYEAKRAGKNRVVAAETGADEAMTNTSAPKKKARAKIKSDAGLGESGLRPARERGARSSGGRRAAKGRPDRPGSKDPA